MNAEIVYSRTSLMEDTTVYRLHNDGRLSQLCTIESGLGVYLVPLKTLTVPYRGIITFEQEDWARILPEIRSKGLFFGEHPVALQSPRRAMNHETRSINPNDDKWLVHAYKLLDPKQIRIIREALNA